MRTELMELAGDKLINDLNGYLGSGKYAELLSHLGKAIKRDECQEFIKNNLDRILLEYINECYKNNTPYSLITDVLESLFKNTQDVFQKNRILNRLEYLNKQVVLKSRPLDLLVGLTDKCNIDCRMCFKKYGWEIPDKIVNEIIGLMPYLETIEWMGGEAFLSKEFERLFNEASKYPRIKQELTTNGLLISEKWVKKLLETKTEIRISMDSVRKDIYERIRRGAKFDDLLNNLTRIKEFRDQSNSLLRKNTYDRASVTVNYIVMRNNYRELFEVVEFARQYDIDRLNFLRLFNNDKNEIFEDEYIENDPEIMAFLSNTFPAVLKKCDDYKIGCIINLPFMDPVRNNTGRKSKPCMIPWLGMDILRADAKPFCFCKENIGKIDNESIMTIWNGDKMQNYRKAIINSKYDHLCEPDCFYGQSRSDYLFIQ